LHDACIGATSIIRVHVGDTMQNVSPWHSD
jgi:hypothetical protein